MEDYYELLEISRNASKEVIDKAYKALIRKYHPDLADADKKAEYEEKLKKINVAYETVIDDVKRAEYDAMLKEKESEKYNQNTNATSDTYYVKSEPEVTVTVTEKRPNGETIEYVEHAYQKQIQDMQDAYDQYIDDIYKSVYGAGNYRYVDNRPFKEKFKDFLHKAKVITITGVIVILCIVIAMVISPEFRANIEGIITPIVKFIQRFIANYKGS